MYGMGDNTEMAEETLAQNKAMVSLGRKWIFTIFVAIKEIIAKTVSGQRPYSQCVFPKRLSRETANILTKYIFNRLTSNL